MIRLEKVIDLTTGQETLLEREETIEERLERERIENNLAQAQAESEARAAQRAIILDRLGITEEEAKLLLS